MRSIVLALTFGLLASVAVAADWGLVANISSTMGANGNRLCVGEGTRSTDIGCPSYAPSVTTSGNLIVSGTVSATSFTGDGSALTGVVASSGDRIVSGTTSMLAVSTTGYISITQAGTNTGWFDPTRGLVTIGVSSTGRISATSFMASHLNSNGYRLDNGAFIQSITSGTPQLNLGAASSAINIFSSTYIGAGSRYVFGFSSAVDPVSGAVDTGLSRYAANKMALGSGTIGDFTGTLLASGVGVGTASPTATLQVSGSFIVSNSAQNTTPSLYVGTNGNVGIGTSSPATKFAISNGSVNDGGPTKIRLNNVASSVGSIVDLVAGDLASDKPYFSIETRENNSPYAQIERLRITHAGNVGVGLITPTTALEVSGTISATNFVGNGSGLTGITAGSSDRIVSGSINAIAEQTSGTVRVSGTLALANSGNETCDAAHAYSLRINPSTQMLQMCRP